VNLLRPVERGRELAGPVPRRLVVGTSTTAKPPRCSLVSTYGPSVKMGFPSTGSTLNTAVERSRPPLEKIRTPAACISSITGLAAAAFSRSSSSVWSGTHSSLNVIRYSGMVVSSQS
jgi:hypothetical protein